MLISLVTMMLPLIYMLTMGMSTKTSRYQLLSRVTNPSQNNVHLVEVSVLSRVQCAVECDRDPFCLSFYHSKTGRVCLLNSFVIPALHLSQYYNSTGGFLYFQRLFERWPRRCADIKAAHLTAPDADYWLYPTSDRVYGNRVRIYCKMSELVPREYLTLPHLNRGLHPPLRNLACVGETSYFTGNEGDILYSKIRLDPDSMLVDNEDFTYASWTGKPIPYGEAGDCYTVQADHVTPSCGPVGYFRLELTDTGMLIAFAQWSYNEANTYMKSTFTTFADVTVNCGGFCGYCDIDAPGILLSVDRSQMINPASAVLLE